MKKTPHIYIPVFILTLISLVGIYPEMHGQINEHFIKGKALAQDDNYTKAIEFYSIAIENSSSKSECFMERGTAYYELGEFEMAIGDFKKVNSLRPAKASYQLAQCYAKLGDIDNTIEHLKNHLDQRNKKYYYEIVKDNAFYEFQENKKWIALWDNEWYDEYESILNEIGLMINVKDYYPAIEFINQHLPDYSEEYELYAFRGSIYSALESYSTAIEDYNKVIKLKPRMHEYLNTRAELYIQISKPKRAIEDYMASIDISPYQFSIRYQLALLQYEQELYEEALENIDFYLKYKPETQSAYLLGGQIYMENKDYLKALEYFNKLLKINQSKAEYFMARGETYYRINQEDYMQYAANDFSMALDLQPNLSEAYLMRARTHYAMGKYQEACFDIKQAHKLGNIEAGWEVNDYCK